MEPVQEAYPPPENLTEADKRTCPSWPGREALGCEEFPSRPGQDDMKKSLIFLAVILALMIPGERVALAAYELEESMGSGALDSWENAYLNACNNVFWGGQGQVCNAAGYSPSHNYTISAVKMYHLACNNAGSNGYKFQVRLNSTGVVLAESNEVTIPCIGDPTAGSDYGSPITTFRFSSPLALSTATTYAMAIAMTTGNTTGNTWWGGRTGGANISGDLYSGAQVEDITMSIAWVVPQNQDELAGYPDYFSLDITSNYAVCARVRGRIDSTYGAFSGRCLRQGVTRINYPVPGEAGLGEFEANFAMYDTGDINILLTSSTITFSTISSSTLQTFQAFIPQTPPDELDFNSTSSPYYIDCSAYEGAPFFSSSTLPGVVCGIKKSIVSGFAALFVPSTDVLNEYANLTLQDKFPFAYFYDIQTLLTSEAATSTAEFPTLRLTYRKFDGSNGTTTLAAFSSSSVSSYVGNSNISLFRTLMQYALWFLFLWYAYVTAVGIFHPKKEE